MRLNIASSVDCLRRTRSRQVAAPGRPSHIRESPISSNPVLPPFYLFAPIAYFLEVLTAVSLILGIFVGLWAMIGAFQIVNLWLGLYSAPGEWPWTYLFLLVLMLIFALHRYGRSLGFEAVVTVRLRPETALGRILLDAAT